MLITLYFFFVQPPFPRSEPVLLIACITSRPGENSRYRSDSEDPGIIGRQAQPYEMSVNQNTVPAFNANQKR